MYNLKYIFNCYRGYSVDPAKNAHRKDISRYINIFVLQFYLVAVATCSF